MQPTPAAVRRVRSWVRGALQLEAGGSWTPERPREPAPQLLEAIRRHRVVEPLAAQADRLQLPEELRSRLAELRTTGRRALMVQILESGRVHALFASAQIPCLIIKGTALAVQSAGDPAARGSGDIDLLVDPSRVEEAHALLTANGWALRPGTEVAPGTWAWRHVLRSFNAFTYDAASSTIDLHWRLDPTLDALPTFEQAWERQEPVDLGGVVVPTLGRADLLAHTSLHAAKDQWRWLRSLVDVHRLAGLPATWEREEPLRRLEVSTLAVTRAALGLPAAVPAEVLEQLDRVPASVLRRSARAQERPVYAEVPFPGVESLRLMRYMVAASSTPRGFAQSAVSTVLPVKAVVGIDARTGWTGVPLTLWHRLRRLRRRSVAWARREPGAGVVDSVVRTSR